MAVPTQTLQQSLNITPPYNLPPHQPIDFIDLRSQQTRLRDKIDLAIKRVLDHGMYIMGPEVVQLEQNLSAFCKARHSISCANGTDALALVLRALNIGRGDAVFVPSFTFVATAEVVCQLGATPVFVDCQTSTFNMCPSSLEQAISFSKQQGLIPKVIIPVDLFGLPADYTAIHNIAHQNNLFVIADAAQSFGGALNGKRVGTLAPVTTTSFFPAKPLGCYGDGGAIFTDDEDLAKIIKSIRVHGQGNDRYHHIHVGLNSRLDTIQAAILLEKLSVFEEEIQQRQEVARRYNDAFQGLKIIQSIPRFFENTISAWAQYTLILESSVVRNALIEHLKKQGIPTMRYYPMPLHLQPAYLTYPCATAARSLPVSEMLSESVLSLPMHPYLTAPLQDYIINAVESF